MGLRTQFYHSRAGSAARPGAGARGSSAAPSYKNQISFTAKDAKAAKESKNIEFRR